MTRPSRPTAGLLLLAALAVAGCGSDSSGSPPAAEIALGHSAAKAQQRRTPKAGAAARSTDPVRTRQGPSVARIPKGTEDEGSSVPKPIRPCTLVKKAEAARITGRRMTRVWEAPQGPTCIFQAARARSYVTMTVEATRFAAIRRHSRTLSKRRIAGHTAYCVRYGQVASYVPLSRGRLLHITASCPVGARFAAKALPRLAG